MIVPMILVLYPMAAKTSNTIYCPFVPPCLLGWNVDATESNPKNDHPRHTILKYYIIYWTVWSWFFYDVIDTFHENIHLDMIRCLYQYMPGFIIVSCIWINFLNYLEIICNEMQVFYMAVHVRSFILWFYTLAKLAICLINQASSPTAKITLGTRVPSSL